MTDVWTFSTQNVSLSLVSNEPGPVQIEPKRGTASRGDIGVEGLSLLTEDLPSAGLVWERFRLASHLNPLLELPARRPATTSLAARRVRRHHRITVIR